MMSGFVDGHTATPASPRRYRVVAVIDGWCVTLGEARTFPFKLRQQAERVATTLQKQADALRGDAHTASHPAITKVL